MPMDHNQQGQGQGRRHFHRGRRGPDRRGTERRGPQAHTPEPASRSDVDVEQIMRDIRGRIAERHGIDLSNQQIQELAARRLEAILDPRSVNPALLDQLRRAAGTPPDTLPPARSEAPYTFEDTTLYDSHRGLMRFIRKLLNPILKLFFNPNPLIRALNIQSRVNADVLAHEAERDRRQAEWNALHYELLTRVVSEISRVTLETQSLSMKVDSLAGKVDFNERRVRGIEGVMHQARPAGRREEGRREEPRREEGRREEGRRDEGRRDEGRREEPRREEGRRDEARREEPRREEGRRDEGRRDEPRRDAPEAPQTQPPPQVVIQAVDGVTGEPGSQSPGAPAEGSRRRRRRRRGRRGAGAAGEAIPGGATEAATLDVDESDEGGEDEEATVSGDVSGDLRSGATGDSEPRRDAPQPPVEMMAIEEAVVVVADPEPALAEEPVAVMPVEEFPPVSQLTATPEPPPETPAEEPAVPAPSDRRDLEPTDR
jgi:hypothetical protein